MTIIIFLAVIAILILVHEWGHFIVAKKSGLIVEEFGFGFPPRIFGWKINETFYSINLLPLGGFVKILGEDGSEVNNPKSFASKSAGVKSLITMAGVAMNFIFGMLLLIGGFYIGLPQILDEKSEIIAKNTQIQIVAVSHDSPAEKANIKLGDSIKNFGEIADLQNFISENKGREINLEIQRDKKILKIAVTPRIVSPEGEGALGVALAKTGVVSYPWHQAIWLGVKSAFTITWEIARGFFELIKDLLIQGKIPQEVAGPVGIAVLTKQAANLGFIYLMQLVAFISLNLTVLNLIPFPALDGGRLLFLGIEKIMGSKINTKVENTAHVAGLILLLLLAAVITWRDILKLI